MLQASMLELLNIIHRLAESSFLLGNQNITYNAELWNSEYHTLLLFKYSKYLETDTKILFSSLKHLVCFIKQYSLRGYPVEQFPTILRVDSYL